MKVEVVMAWPRRFLTATVALPDGARVADAVAAAAKADTEAPETATAFGAALAEVDGYAIHGVRADADTPLRDGDRVELLRPLQVDPKEARRRRASRKG